MASLPIKSDVHDMSYYGKCMIGGILSCGLTHAAVCPLDIIKCRKQVDPKIYKSIGDGFRTVIRTEGYKGLSVGVLPTLIGYSAQGFGKFGFYEIFKDVYKWTVGEQNAKKYQTFGFLAASACAEVIADVLLCPFESVKVRMQTAQRGAFTDSFVEGFNRIKTTEGTQGFYKGLAPLWMRQIPYTMMKFAMFENTVRTIYSKVLTSPKESYSKATQLSVTFISGYWAGIFCAVVSHPADTIVSKLNNRQSKGNIGQAVGEIYREIGFSGLWRGLGARILMVGTLTGFQWWIYDSFKTKMGLQTTGGK